MLQAALVQGIHTLGFSDHLFPFTDPAIFPRVRREVGPAPEGLDLFFGCEVDVLAPGVLGVDAEGATAFDFVIAGATHYPCPHVERPPVDDPEACAAHYLAMFATACAAPFVDFISHPFHVPDGIFAFDPLALIRPQDLAPAIEDARRNHVAVEIQPKNMHPQWREWYLAFYRQCKEAGLKFAFGSDAHHPRTLGATAGLRPLVDALGLTDADIWLPTRRAA